MNYLYDTDYYAWTISQAKALENRDIVALDWENLKEEIELIGNEVLHAVNSLLKQILIHRLKLDYTNDIYSRNHWEDEIDNFQDSLSDRLSNSLRNKIDLAKIYSRAKREVLKKYDIDLPQECPYTLEDLLNKNEKLS